MTQINGVMSSEIQGLLLNYRHISALAKAVFQQYCTGLIPRFLLTFPRLRFGKLNTGIHGLYLRTSPLPKSCYDVWGSKGEA